MMHTVRPPVIEGRGRQLAARWTSGPSPLYLKTRLCKFNTQGKCKRGAACLFAHCTSELKAAPDFFKTRLCPTVTEGGVCLYDNCTFAHNTAELRAPPLVLGGFVVLSDDEVNHRGTGSRRQDDENAPSWMARRLAPVQVAPDEDPRTINAARKSLNTEGPDARLEFVQAMVQHLEELAASISEPEVVEEVEKVMAIAEKLMKDMIREAKTRSQKAGHSMQQMAPQQQMPAPPPMFAAQQQQQQQQQHAFPRPVQGGEGFPHQCEGAAHAAPEVCEAAPAPTKMMLWFPVVAVVPLHGASSAPALFVVQSPQTKGTPRAHEVADWDEYAQPDHCNRMIPDQSRDVSCHEVDDGKGSPSLDKDRDSWLIKCPSSSDEGFSREEVRPVHIRVKNTFLELVPVEDELGRTWPTAHWAPF